MVTIKIVDEPLRLSTLQQRLLDYQSVWTIINYRLLIDWVFIECRVPVPYACPTVYPYNKQKILSLLIIFVFSNSVDPYEMSHYAAFHLGLHCLIAEVRVKESSVWASL